MVKLIRRLLHSARPAICDDVAVWGRAHKTEVFVIHEPVYDEIASLGKEDALARSEIEAHEADLKRPQSLVVIQKARVRDAIGLVFLPDGTTCYQGNWFRPYLTENPSYQAHFRKKRFVKGDIFSLLGLWSAEFYHWFHDTLPRLWTSLPHLPSGTRFLIQKNPRSYQLDSLAALGIRSDRLEYQNNRGDTVIERLWFATPVGHSSFTAAGPLKEIADQFKKKFVPAPGSGKRRIYISRRKAISRRVLNESEIEPILKSNGFEIFILEDLPFAKQVEVCASANVLIGPHGAGLTNLLYCHPESKIGEIATNDVFPHYLGMARQMGHSFFRLTAERKGEDLIVSVNDFQSWLEANFK